MCFGALYARHCGHSYDLYPWIARRCTAAESAALDFCGAVAQGTTTIMLPSCEVCMTKEEKVEQDAFKSWERVWSAICAEKRRQWEEECAVRWAEAEAKREMEDAVVDEAGGGVDGVSGMWWETVGWAGDEPITLAMKLESRRKANLRKAR